MSITALAVDVPEAERLVGSLREQHDPTTRLGVPAHITVLVPFMAPEQLTPAIEARLERTFRMHPAFDFALAGVGRFPGVAFLAPEPAARFMALTEAMVSEFPDHLPYGASSRPSCRTSPWRTAVRATQMPWRVNCRSGSQPVGR